MKPEKMTDEALAEIRRDFDMGNKSIWEHAPDNTEALLSHIAALESEREEAAGALLSTLRVAEGHGWKPWQHLGAFLGQQLDALDALSERAQTLEAERDALRERVQALKEQVRDLGARLDGVKPYALILESRLAAIHQRAGDEGALVRTALTAEPLDRAATRLHEGVVAVASFILGDAPESGRCVNQQPRSPESERHLVQIVRSTEATVRGMSASPEVCPDPTTAEAFATQSEALDWLENNPTDPEAQACRRKARAALSLLERRMGAMVRAIHAFLHRDAEEVTTEDEEALSSALTDAPPVFTLEEVDKALTRAGVSSVNARDVLSALRR